MNVLLLIFDDLVPLLGCYGDPIAQTPNLDRLAARGVTFTRASTSCAICSPGRASLFTGLRPDSHGVSRLGHRLRARLPDVITWPQALRNRGWYTSGAGKVYHKGVPDGVSVPGTEANHHGCGDPASWDRFRSPGGMELNCNGTMRNYTPWETHTAGIGGAISWLRAEKKDSIHHDARVAEEVCREIRNHDDDRPAFWAAGFVRPHVPLVAPKRFFELYDDVNIPIPQTPSHATPLPQPVVDQWCSNFGLSQDERREAMRAYYACISFVDEQIGRILDQLERSGKADDTLVIVSGDHGFQLGEHGLWFKNYLYRESLHIPLIICDPRRSHSHGARCDALVEQPDLFPTLQDLLEFDQPVRQDFEGVSLLPLIENPSDRVRTGSLSQVDWAGVEGRSLTTERWKYIRYSGSHQQEQLFDISVDPGEHIDLLDGGGEHPELSALRRALSGGWRSLLEH
jgi:uncharacterized sulfatase